MNLHEHEQPKAGAAGLVNLTQRAEIATILAGKWPALKPLPVLKYETDDHRVAIDFDKLRGEWVCRKTWLPSGRVQELRGGLGQILSALPNTVVDLFSLTFAESAEQELVKDAERRRQSMLDWREHCANGGRYAGLQEHLSESQRQEIDDSLRLTLTARQLQCSAKNIAYVFDALASAGGRFATLLEIARENSGGKTPDDPVPTQTTTSSHETLRVPPLALRAAVGGSVSPSPEASATAPRETTLHEADRIEWTDPMAYSGGQMVESATPESLRPNWLLSGDDLQEDDFPQEEEALLPQQDDQEKIRGRERGYGFAELARKVKLEQIATPIENPASHSRTLELSGFHLAALAFLFAVISFSVGLAMSRGLFGEGLQEAQKTMLASAGESSARPERSSETGTRTDAPPIAYTFEASRQTPTLPAPTPEALSPQAPSLPTSAQKPVGPSVPSQGVTSAASAANARTTVSPSETTSHEVVSADSSATANEPEQPAATAENTRIASRDSGPLAKVSSTDVVPNKVVPTIGLTPYRFRPSAVLVTTPSRGNKPFRVSFPEKAIAASSSFAMTSQFSVVVPPDPGSATPHRSARLQAGELQSFVWPRYTKLGERSASAETVKVRATIGKLGQVQDIKLVSGSSSLFPAVQKAIRAWHYRPTLLNQRPVASQQEVTIEFRPSQYLSRVHEPYSARND